MGRGRRIERWQQLDPPFSYLARPHAGRHGTVKRGIKEPRNVANRFRGEGTHKVDAKGRVSIPATFRRVLAENDPDWTEGKNPQLVIVYGDETRNYLECYSMRAMNEMEDMIEDMEIGSPDRDYLEDFFIAYSQDTAVDETGRLVLSAKLREKAGIEGEAYFKSRGGSFEIWNPDRYDEYKARQAEKRADRPVDFNPKSLLQKRSAE
jgi:MraZ protein